MVENETVSEFKIPLKQNFKRLRCSCELKKKKTLITIHKICFQKFRRASSQIKPYVHWQGKLQNSIKCY